MRALSLCTTRAGVEEDVDDADEEGEEEDEDEDMSVEEEDEEDGADFEGMDEEEFEHEQSTLYLNKIKLSEVTSNKHVTYQASTQLSCGVYQLGISFLHGSTCIYMCIAH